MRTEDCPVDPEMLLLQALAVRSVGELDHAIELALRAAGASDGNDDSILLAAEMLTEAEQPERAVCLLRSAVGRFGDRADFSVALGAALLQLNQTDEATETLESVLARDPANAWVLNLLGHQYVSTGQLAEFERVVQSVAHASNETSEHYVAAAKTLATFGHQELADEFLDRAQRLDPGVGTGFENGAIRGEPVTEFDPVYVRNLFDRFAESYDLALARIRNRGPDVLAVRLARLFGGDASPQLQVLDAGCGTGLCGPVLKPYADKLVGIDLSDGMLRHARDRDCYDELQLLSLLNVSDPFSDRFDLIVACDVMCYFGDLHPVVTSLRRCLREDGRLFLTVEVSSDPATEDFRLQPCGRFQHKREYVTDVVECCGLEIIETSLEDLRFEYDQPVRAYCLTSQFRRDLPN